MACSECKYKCIDISGCFTNKMEKSFQLVSLKFYKRFVDGTYLQTKSKYARFINKINSEYLNIKLNIKKLPDTNISRC